MIEKRERKFVYFSTNSLCYSSCQAFKVSVTSNEQPSFYKYPYVYNVR